MPLQILGPDGHGIIWIVDQKPDKTIVMLACSPQSPRAGGVVPDGESADDDEIFPLFEATLQATVLDVTNLPPGPQRFESNRFLDRAALYANHHEQVRLSEDSARQFGAIDVGGEAKSGLT